jgi:hypothetical protein
MRERDEPDLDQVRDAMRDHDERLREEDAGDERPREEAGQRDGGGEDEDDDHEGGA